jgi:hypothetical protein
MVRATRSPSIAPLFALLALLLGGLARTGQAQNNWGRYAPGTMAAVIQQHDSAIRADHAGKKGAALIVSGDDFPTRARVIYRGDSRPLDSNRREVLREWSLAFLRDTSALADFHREYLFQEGTREMWLPVQDAVAGYFSRELQPGQPVMLFVIWAGAHYAGKDITWTFLVNEFKAESAGK